MEFDAALANFTDAVARAPTLALQHETLPPSVLAFGVWLCSCTDGIPVYVLFLLSPTTQRDILSIVL